MTVFYSELSLMFTILVRSFFCRYSTDDSVQLKQLRSILRKEAVKRKEEAVWTKGTNNYGREKRKN